MLCPRCKGRLPDGSRYCTHCSVYIGNYPEVGTTREESRAERKIESYPGPRIISCPACEKQVSSEAVSCPQCGQPLKKAQPIELTHKKFKKQMILGGVIMVGALAISPFCCAIGPAGLAVSGLLFLVGGFIYFFARIDAWWHHG